MYPRQSLTPRCSAKPTRHPAHPDVDPHAVFETQLALRLELTPVHHTGESRRNVYFCTPREGADTPPGAPKPNMREWINR